ncbi:MAG: phytoene/squalene synthase family protein [Gammaproteobacteria bacterium]|nr:phytoene/squalene synthase family protein [Gammaproteobacteria bacterium]
MATRNAIIPAAHSVHRDGGRTESDEQFQARMLRFVSRTFALTIPQLPDALREAVGNGYLLCRIVDTIEDDAVMPAAQKRVFCEKFTAVVEGRADAAQFAAELGAALGPATPPAERDLVLDTPRVIAIMNGFRPAQQEALRICVAVMAEGMAAFQERKDPAGVPTLADMDRYCYYVAGVVGEMLTRLFCDYSTEIARRREELMPLAVSFGQALQMTNILKDIWEDRERGACWLPRDVFASHGFDLRDLSADRQHPGFEQGLADLIGVAHGHVRNALRYTLLLPPHETGLRNFCLWALGMAILTLRKINKNRSFVSGRQVKITRRSVKATIAISQWTVRNDRLLWLLFRMIGAGVPSTAVQIG